MMESESAKNISIQEPHYVFKFIIIGDTGVGKSCLLLQFIDNRFRLKHQPTIGVQFGARTISAKPLQNHETHRYVKLQIWDTAGQESFRSITRGYYRSAAGAILVYDVTNLASFQNLSHWLNEAKVSGNPQMSFLLVGNKNDLDIDRKVSYEEGYKFAEENNMEFLQVSAKTSHNVVEAFTRVTNSILSRIDNNQIDLKQVPPGIKVGQVKKSTFDSEHMKDLSTKSKRKCC